MSLKTVLDTMSPTRRTPSGRCWPGRAIARSMSRPITCGKAPAEGSGRRAERHLTRPPGAPNGSRPWLGKSTQSITQSMSPRTHPRLAHRWLES